MSESYSTAVSTIGSVAVGAVSFAGGAVLGLVGGLKSWMDHKQVEFRRDALERYIDNMKLQSGTGKQDVLKMEMVRRLIEGGEHLAYFKVKGDGGISWMDNGPGDNLQQDLYWHPNANFGPHRARFLYVQDSSIKHFGARKVPNGKQ